MLFRLPRGEHDSHFVSTCDRSLTAVDFVIEWSTILWLVVAICPQYRWVRLVHIPCFVSVSLTTVLQLSFALNK